jgi:alpha-tubulin suppressor-like RCC1 family protein
LRFSFRQIVAAALTAVLVTGLVPNAGVASAASAQKPKIVDILIGAGHVLALDSEGGVWSWGKSEIGALGQGDLTDVPTPKKMDALPPVRSIAAAQFHSVAADRDGNVWVWGSNTSGELGNGDYTRLRQVNAYMREIAEDRNAKVPVKNGLSGIVSVFAQDAYSFAVDHEGRVYTWGGAYQINDPNLDDTLLERERGKLSPRMVEGLDRIVYVTHDVSYNGEASHALDRNGRIWRWGWRVVDGKSAPFLEQVPDIEQVRQYRADYGFYWAQDASGAWKQWGFDLFDESGLNPMDRNNRDRIPRNEVPVATPQLQGFAQIEISTYMYGQHSLVGLKPDGTVWTWGSNAEGQLGVSGMQKTDQWIKVDLPHKIVKVAARGGTVFAITENGGVYSWGSNSNNKLGYGSTAPKWSVPKLLPDFGSDDSGAGQPQSQPSAGQQQGQPAAGQPAASGPATHVYLNGERLNFEAVVIQGSTMVPFRDLFGAFNMSVDWNQQTKTVTAKKEGVTLQLTVGSTTSYVNGEKKELSVAPAAVNGKTFVNLRFISETVGAQVDYRKVSPDLAEVRITYGN